MPKIEWERLPREKWAHLRRRAKERKISEGDLFQLAEWKAQDPEVPDGDWYKAFGTFKLCASARYPNTFLIAGQAARGKRFSPTPPATDSPLNPPSSPISTPSILPTQT